MEPEETATIVRLVKSVFPQQPIDRATYETWHLVIGELSFQAAQEAVLAVAHSQSFCSAADIIREAERAARPRHPPYDRTVAEAIAGANLWALDAAPPQATEPPAEYDERKAALLRRLIGRAAAVPARVGRELAVACPWCHAAPGEQCVNIGTRAATRPHSARAEAAGKAA